MISIILYSLYLLIAASTGWVSQTVFSAHLSANPSTRERGIGWISWPLGVLSGITWPITIPVAIIVAGLIK